MAAVGAQTCGAVLMRVCLFLLPLEIGLRLHSLICSVNPPALPLI